MRMQERKTSHRFGKQIMTRVIFKVEKNKTFAVILFINWSTDKYK